MVYCPFLVLLLVPGKGAKHSSVCEYICYNFTTVACGRVSILHWRQCIMLGTSGFAEDIIIKFSYNGANGLEQKQTRRYIFIFIHHKVAK